MLSEQDFYLLNGNQYRGSRYANFAGAGVDAQGNVSSAVNENAANLGKGTSVDPTQPAPEKIAPGVAQAATSTPSNIAASLPGQKPTTLGGAAKDMVIGAALPSAGSTIGSVVGANIASGNGAFTGVGQAIQNRVSAGLLGSSTNATATNAALGSMGGKFGPATQSAVGRAAGGSAIGSAAGVGLGSAAATLLTGGSIKDAAISGVGSGIGFAVGNMIVPGVGGFIGSTLGSMAAGLFGGGEKRTTLGVILRPGEDGQMKTNKVSTKGSDNATASKYAGQIGKILNQFGQATGIKYTNSVQSETNIGSKDTGTFMGRDRVSSKAGDSGAVALKYLQDRSRYTLGNDADFNSFWDKTVTGAKSINDLGKSVDNFYASRGLMAAPTPPNAANIAPMVNQARRYGDRAMSFYG